MKTYRITYDRPDMNIRCSAIKTANSEKAALDFWKKQMKVTPTNVEIREEK